LNRYATNCRPWSIGFCEYACRLGNPGGKETAHQIINTGDVELKYLAVSTKLSPEIAEYPDSGKFGVLADFPADADGKTQRFMFIGREGESGDYWEGE